MSGIRLLLVAALLAIGVGLLAGAAVAAPWDWTAPPFTTNTIPTALAWDQSVDASFVASNTGDNPWTTSQGVVSVDPAVVTGDPVTKVSRWRLNSLTFATNIAMGQTTVRLNGLVGPAIAPMHYAALDGVMAANAPAVPDTLSCSWVLADMSGVGVPYAGVAPMGKSVTVGRFPDMLPAAQSWVAAQTEQLAGLFPIKITGGLADGTYGPAVNVDRGTMAVFLQRALQTPTAAYQGLFTDVLSTDWNWQAIESLKTAGLVNGATATTYDGGAIVDRGTMAVFLARALNSPSYVIPDYLGTAHFSDVPDFNWDYDAIEFCQGQGIANGNADGTFTPRVAVNRGSMAAFLNRAFIMPNDCMVVLAGPGVTDVDPKTAPAGVSSDYVGATFAYVGFDAVRLGALVPTVHFVIKNVKTGATVASGDDTLDVDDIADATAVVPVLDANGDQVMTTDDPPQAVGAVHPYVYATFPIPPLALTAGQQYQLIVSVGSDVMARQVTFAVPAVPADITATSATIGAGTEVSGTFADTKTLADAEADPPVEASFWGVRSALNVDKYGDEQTYTFDAPAFDSLSSLVLSVSDRTNDNTGNQPELVYAWDYVGSPGDPDADPIVPPVAPGWVCLNATGGDPVAPVPVQVGLTAATHTWTVANPSHFISSSHQMQVKIVMGGFNANQYTHLTEYVGLHCTYLP